jgi:hypothetical protein
VFVYDRTNHADLIEREGLRDTERAYMTDLLWRGVWVSADWPLDLHEGARGGAVLSSTSPRRSSLSTNGWRKGRTNRRALIPAADRHRQTLRRRSDEGVDELDSNERYERWRGTNPGTK